MSAAFDVRTVPLAGKHLVEASAGTGKTYAIGELYVRLLVESALRVEQILVVTFTEAATAELRERLRRRLTEALGDPRYDEPERARLRAAIEQFDLAAVHTIHGFCQRVLRESTFESNAAFDTEVVPDPSPMRRDVLVDFCVSTFGTEDLVAGSTSATAAGSPLHLPASSAAASSEAASSAARDEAVTVPFDTLAKLERHWTREDVEFVPAGGRVAEQHAAIRRLAGLLGIDSGAVPASPVEPGAAASGAKPGKKRRPTTFSAARDDLVQQLRTNPRSVPELLEAIANCRGWPRTRISWTRQRRPRCAACSNSIRAARRQQAAIAYCRREFPARLADRGLMSFDQLVTRLRDAVAARPELVARVAKRYRAAMIDEFQDTDPSQLAIFRRLFADESACVFRIGDPKQSIYRFRGADVHAYLAARREDGMTRHTMAVNWRSDPCVLRAVARVFAGPRPFLVDDLEFPAVRARDGCSDALAVVGDSPGGIGVGLDVVWLTGGGKSIEGWHDAAARAAAREIVELLDGGPQLQTGEAGEPRRVLPSDVAVLTRTNREVFAVREALAAAGVPAVALADQSVFETGEARELVLFLQAVLAPTVGAAVRRALLSRFAAVQVAELVDAPDAVRPQGARRALATRTARMPAARSSNSGGIGSVGGTRFGTGSASSR